MLDNLQLPNETIDKIYDDAVHPAASEAGKFAGRIPRLINAALAPLDCWILEREHHIEKTKQLLEENLKNKDPEKIVPPDPYVAVPASQTNAYLMHLAEFEPRVQVQRFFLLTFSIFSLKSTSPSLTSSAESEFPCSRPAIIRAGRSSPADRVSPVLRFILSAQSKAFYDAKNFSLALLRDFIQNPDQFLCVLPLFR